MVGQSFKKHENYVAASARAACSAHELACPFAHKLARPLAHEFARTLPHKLAGALEHHPCLQLVRIQVRVGVVVGRGVEQLQIQLRRVDGRLMRRARHVWRRELLLMLRFAGLISAQKKRDTQSIHTSQFALTSVGANVPSYSRRQ